MQLQAVYGDVGVKLEVPEGAAAKLAAAAKAGAANGTNSMHASTSSSAPRDVRTSIHRCLIYLGDLARYNAQAAPKAAVAVAGPGPNAPAVGNTAAKPEWHLASQFYRQAAHLLPRSGNPYNQLAVMAVMTGDELRAVYHYARSLCVGLPFLTARENLLLLFEQNRARYSELLNRRKQQEQQQHPQSTPLPQLSQELAICYVRLSGLLFDRINQHEFPGVCMTALAAVGSFLDHPQVLGLLHRQSRADCSPLHLVVLAIFAVHNCCGSHSERASGAQVSYGDAAQRSLLHSRALTVLFRTGQLLVQAAAANPGIACLMVAANVLMHWLAAQPQYASSNFSHATDNEAQARIKFWLSGGQLVAAVAAACPSAVAAGLGSLTTAESNSQGRKAAHTAAATVAGQQGVAVVAGSGSAGDDPYQGGALPEELELLGFEPLRSKHHWHVTDVGRHLMDEPGTRARRMLAAARVIAAAVVQQQQQQPSPRHTAAASGVQAQTVKQLAAAEQQFMADLAAAVSGSEASTAHTTAGAADGVAAGDMHEQQQQQAHSRPQPIVGKLLHNESLDAVSMDVEAEGQQPHHTWNAAVAALGAAAAATAAAARCDSGVAAEQQADQDEEELEEVIVFQPKVNHVSSPFTSVQAATEQAAATAAATADNAAEASNQRHAQYLPGKVRYDAGAAAAAEPPPLPQQLLSTRQRQQQPQRQSQQQEPMPMLISPAGSTATTPVIRRQQLQQPASTVPTSAAPSCADGPSSSSASGVLFGHAATALDVQQAQAASNMLLARLSARVAPRVPNQAIVGGLRGSMAANMGANGQQQFVAGIPSSSTAGYGVNAPASLGLDGLGTVSGNSMGMGMLPTMQQAIAGFVTAEDTMPVSLLAMGLSAPRIVPTLAGSGDMLGLSSGMQVAGLNMDLSGLSHTGLGGFDAGSSRASAPIDIQAQQQQLLTGLADSAELSAGAAGLHLVGSLTAGAYRELEQTARAAADKILSPEHDEEPSMLQHARHFEHMVQQAQRQQQQQPQPLGEQLGCSAWPSGAAVASRRSSGSNFPAVGGGAPIGSAAQNLINRMDHQGFGALGLPNSNPGTRTTSDSALAAALAAGDDTRRRFRVHSRASSWAMSNSSTPKASTPLAANAATWFGSGGAVGLDGGVVGQAVQPVLKTSAGYDMFGPGPDLFASGIGPSLQQQAADALRHVSDSGMGGPPRLPRTAATAAAGASAGVGLLKGSLTGRPGSQVFGAGMQGLELSQTDLLQNDTLHGDMMLDSPHRIGGPTLLESLARQQQLPGAYGSGYVPANGQLGQAANAGPAEVSGQQHGLGALLQGNYNPLGNFSASNGLGVPSSIAPGVLLPPLDFGQSQNPFAS
eukprot:GHRR01004950.1.p1 GENE.GHRR01004950.1~~GHRR01004950.1.p1  ORF type:complete len:1360 (+),score=644.13 GHRR01004950.1:1193-5272(+)